MRFKHHSIMGCIYACLIAIPMVSILSRVIYVQFNKNAKDSYYGETINERIDVKVDYTNLQGNNTYYFNKPHQD